MDINLHTKTYIEHYTHFFTVKTSDRRVIAVVHHMVDKYTERVWTEAPNRKPFFVGGSIFAARVVDNSEFRFLQGQYAEFKRLLEHAGVLPERLIETKMPVYVPHHYDYQLTASKSLYDYQERARSFAISSMESVPHTAMIGMPTGTGKTVTLCSIAAQMKVRFAVAVLPKYLEKWGNDLASNLDLSHKEIMLVSGSDRIAGLVNMVKKNKKKAPDTLVISITTMRLFVEAYSKDPAKCREDYGCIPSEFWGLMGVGLIGIDEAHEHLHEIYSVMVHVHGPRLVALSGTMLSERPFEVLVQKTMFPYSIRFNDIKMKKYIKVFQITYHFRDDKLKFIKTTEKGRSTYSHTAFEKSIYKNPDLLRSYLLFIKQMVDNEFLHEYKPGDKLAIYASTINMCTAITHFLREWLGKRFDIRRYVEKDPYENVIVPDIRVTSILKAGAAIDIPNLRVVINTISVSSHKAVIQLLGRLRELKDRDVKMYFAYCGQLPKHMAYAHNCRELIVDRVLSIKTTKTMEPI